MVHELGGSTFAIPVVYGSRFWDRRVVPRVLPVPLSHIKGGNSARHVKNCVGVFGVLAATPRWPRSWAERAI